jgi:hypothetical protein
VANGYCQQTPSVAAILPKISNLILIFFVICLTNTPGRLILLLTLDDTLYSENEKVPTKTVIRSQDMTVKRNVTQHNTEENTMSYIIGFVAIAVLIGIALAVFMPTRMLLLSVGVIPSICIVIFCRVALKMAVHI